ncbi:MAG: hypothetical protein JNN05_09860 [Candidatus Omnitrophica bacterium]|nr:hypothetical protein [Candidatus Omnitrophota bacterium]
MDLVSQIKKNTEWLVSQQDLIAARLSYVLRMRGVDVSLVICAKIYPDIKDPTGGVLVLPPDKVFQFGFNRAGVIVESAQVDEWINISGSFNNHMWRDEILTALQLVGHPPQQK